LFDNILVNLKEITILKQPDFNRPAAFGFVAYARPQSHRRPCESKADGGATTNKSQTHQSNTGRNLGAPPVSRGLSCVPHAAGRGRPHPGISDDVLGPLGIWRDLAAVQPLREIAAKNATRGKSSEPAASRALHVFMANAAVLLLFVPVPGLTRRCLPAPRIFVPIGLTVQTAALLPAIWARRHLGRNWSGRITIW
jgi:hypothetical protein